MYKCTVCKSRMNEAERFSHRSLCMDSQTLRKRKSDEIDSSGSSNYCYEGTEVGRMSQSKMKMQRAYISLPCTDIRKYVDPSQKLNHRILCHRNVSISVKPKSEYLESTSASCESNGITSAITKTSGVLFECGMCGQQVNVEKKSRHQATCMELYNTGLKFEKLHI